MTDPKRRRLTGQTEPRKRALSANDADSKDAEALTPKTANSPNSSDKKPLLPSSSKTNTSDGDGGWTLFSFLSWLGGSKKQPTPAVTTVPSKAIKEGSAEPDSGEKRRIGSSNEATKQKDGGNKSLDLQGPDKTRSKERIVDPLCSTMISVNSDDSDMPEFIAPELLADSGRQSAINIRELFDREVVSNVTTEAAVKPKCKYQQVSFARAQTVYILPPTRQRLHKKIIRSRHDAWRRHGALAMIHQLGGWSYTIQGKNKVYSKIVKGTPLPPAPTAPPILTEEEFHKRPIITIPTSNKDGKSRRQRNKNKEDSKKTVKAGDSDTTVSDDDPPSC